MRALYDALAEIRDDLFDLGEGIALIGGLAVTTHTDPRTTRDVDLAVSVSGDSEAERLVRDLKARGYREVEIRENEVTGRLALVQLEAPSKLSPGTRLDLLFGFTGIEEEIVEAAESLEILRGLVMPVARIGHLIALKIHADRRRDRDDGEALIRAADAEELQLAREAIAQIALRNDLDAAELDQRLDLWIERSKVEE